MSENLVKFKSGTQDQYNSLETKDTNTLYFTSDTLKIYKGDKPYVKGFWTGNVEQRPETGEEGILYICTDEKKMYVWTPDLEGSGSYTLAFEASMVTLDKEVTEQSENGVTSKAIYTFVTNKVAEIISGGGAEGVFVTQVVAADEVATLTVHRGESEQTNVKIKLQGLAKLPTYDSHTRKITFQDAENGETGQVIVDLGKDLVVQSGRYDSEQKKIILVLSDDDSTEIEIDVKDLISAYAASEDLTGAVKLTISDVESGKEIKAELQLDEESKLNINKQNQLTIDLSDYVTSAALSSLSSTVQNLQETVEGFDTTYVKNEELTTTLETYALKTYVDEKVSGVSEKVTTVENTINESLTWGTINV